MIINIPPVRVYCAYCSYFQEYTHGTLKTYCTTCQKYFEAYSFLSFKKTSFVIKTCPHCQNTGSYQPQYKKENGFFFPLHEIINYLWLQKSYKRKRFFALNKEHLHYLKQFIAADLRERNGIYTLTYIAKLPKFIKSRKNRTGLLKIIRQLEEKVE